LGCRVGGRGVECMKRFVTSAMIAVALRFVLKALKPTPRLKSKGVPRRKVRTPKGAMVGNAHRLRLCQATQIGKVPQKLNRLGHGACVLAAVRVKR
jgi:hypothetical protein